MYIVDDIAYAQKKAELLKVTEIKVVSGYTLWLKFSTGEEKLFDFFPLLDKPAFIPLNDQKVFSAVQLDHGFPIWQNGDIDISPEFLYENGKTA